ncbi:Unknown protein [Striga hermonthica]|uniref:F-box domain-containing protein n=1 Tax=Striga hermonthica TaxID=68872 RepID=A0A9N7R248_STRHE|nr:Unknown protein [Striga hermonthica]
MAEFLSSIFRRPQSSAPRQQENRQLEILMAKIRSCIFRRRQSSARRHRPWSWEIEAEGEEQAGVCAQNNLLISLHDDLLFKILLNLSAEDIYRASLACRSLYYRTILSEKFVNLHFRQTEEYDLLFRFSYAPTHELIAFLVSMKQGSVTVSDYKSIFIFDTSCNGLILQHNSVIRVVNPVTGRSFRLPPIPKNAMLTRCCLGYSEVSKAYKVTLAYIARRRGPRRAILTVGVDKSWRDLGTVIVDKLWSYLGTDRLMEFANTLGRPLVTESFIHGRPLVTEGFIHFIYGDTVLTLNVETEVITETRVPLLFPVYPPKYMRWYLSTGKALTLVVRFEDGLFRVWEMVLSGNCYYWREWERQIVLESRLQEVREVCGDKYRPVGWLQQMEVLVFEGLSEKWRCTVMFYVVIATGEIGWISTPISKGLVGKFYRISDRVLPHKNTLVQLEGYH